MVGNRICNILIDTGSDLNLVRHGISKHINSSKRIVFQGVGGQITRTLGRVRLGVEVQGHKMKGVFQVVKEGVLGEHDMFLGIDFMVDNKLIIDFDKLKLYNKHFSTDLFAPSDKESYDELSEPEEESLCEFTEPKIVECNVVQVEEEVKDNDKKFNLEHLNENTAKDIATVLDKYPNVFSKLSKDEFPSLTFNSLELTSNRPVQSKIYRFPEAHKALVLEEMKKLLKLNVISYSKSNYNSPVWIVAKKDDENGEKQWRIVIDYRFLNKITIPDRFPLPIIADIIDQLGDAKFFSVLDLVSGFHQVALKSDDRYKTAFTVCGQLYEFNRLPFGLINSAPAFQRIMTQVLGDLVGQICFCYIDDIVVYGRDLEEHNKNLDLVLQRLSDNKLKVKPSKCHFLKEQISYLGYIISPKGIQMDPKKTEAIKRFVAPKTAKQIKSFVGLAGFYRKFIKDFGDIAVPLNNLLRKDVPFVWDESCQHAFTQLIDAISNDIILQFPRFDRRFYLTCDASNVGIGAVLSQENDQGIEQPIAFISKSLNKHEKNYSTTERECLAIVWAIGEFRNYLVGHAFTVRTDHKPLVWLHNIQDPGAKLLRWRLKLNDYDYDIEYIKGKINVVADELSRNGFHDDDCPFSEEKIIPSVFNIDQVDASDDEEDEETLETIDTIPRNDRKKITDKDRIIALIKEQHCGPIGGHRGVNATTAVLSIYFDIPGLRALVSDFIKTCEICQRTKYDRQNRNLPLTHTVTASEPNERIAFDIIGPFKYPDGNKYYGLTIQDDFSKFILFCGIRDCTAEVVAKALVENWILYLGIPKILLSDNGSNLCGEIMTGIANYFNIKRITTSVAHPQSNGSVERAHARLAEFIRSTHSELENDKEWSSRLKLASYCYNNTVHSTTGYSPYYLMFGRHPRMITALEEEDILTDTYLHNFNRNLKTVWTKAKNNMDKRKEEEIKRREERVKRRAKVIEFKVGDKVLIRNKALKGLHNRTEDVWIGPFDVIEVRDTNLVVKRWRRTSTFNKADIKPFVTESP